MRMDAKRLALLVKAKLRDRITTQEIPGMIYCDYRTALRILGELCDAGFLEKIGRGVYRITQKGTDELKRRDCELMLTKFKRDGELGTI